MKYFRSFPAMGVLNSVITNKASKPCAANDFIIWRRFQVRVTYTSPLSFYTGTPVNESLGKRFSNMKESTRFVRLSRCVVAVGWQRFRSLVSDCHSDDLYWCDMRSWISEAGMRLEWLSLEWPRQSLLFNSHTRLLWQQRTIFLDFTFKNWGLWDSSWLLVSFWTLE